MKPKTKAKLQRYAGSVGRFIKNYWPWMMGGALIATMKTQNEHAKLINGVREAVNYNAAIQNEELERLSNLERQQNMLFERALKETEGKAE